MLLDNRKKEVLHAIVDDYVSTNEPVGSKSLIERHNFQVSSATLRNDMAELEHLGLIEKPHTSAGRIPSDKGYREYVNSLMTIEELSPKEQLEIEKRIDSSVDEVTDLIKNATHTLSETTGFVSLAMSPRLKKSFLKQLKILMIEPGKALVVMVLSAGVVKDKVVRIPNFLSDEQIMKISGAIEKNLTGKPLDEITLVTVETAGKGTEVPEPLLYRFCTKHMLPSSRLMSSISILTVSTGSWNSLISVLWDVQEIFLERFQIQAWSPDT